MKYGQDLKLIDDIVFNRIISGKSDSESDTFVAQKPTGRDITIGQL
jgi:hypothetical protein